MRNTKLYLFFIRVAAKYIHDTRGVSAILIVLLAVPIFGAVGLSIDLGRTYVLKSKLLTALDSAGLAAGRVIFDEDAKVLADAQKFFDANFPPGYMDADISALNITWDTDRENISLSVNATFDTTFINILGYPTLSVGVNTVINRVNRGLELIMVLDNTGSMARDSTTNSYSGSDSNRRIEALRDAAKDLVDILYGSNETQENLWIGIVPYVTQVNVGYRNIGFLEQDEQNKIISSTNSPYADEHSDYELPLLIDVDVDGDYDTNYGWKGCVEMRGHLLASNSTDTTDNPPNQDFMPYVYYHGKSSENDPDYDNDWVDGSPGILRLDDPDDVTQWNSFNNSIGRGPNAGCPTAILPLTAEKTTIMASLDDMRPWYSGGTMGNVGMIWGWRALSPRWRGLWKDSEDQLPLDYDEPLVDKAVIMMTDGENLVFSHQDSSAFDYNSYARHEKSDHAPAPPSPLDDTSNSYTDDGGRLKSTSSTTYKNQINAKFAQTCEDMKDEGIIVFTIKFKSGNDSLYRNCATSEAHYFDSPTADDLADAFHSIGQELSNLRVAQ